MLVTEKICLDSKEAINEKCQEILGRKPLWTYRQNSGEILGFALPSIDGEVVWEFYPVGWKLYLEDGEFVAIP